GRRPSADDLRPRVAEVHANAGAEVHEGDRVNAADDRRDVRVVGRRRGDLLQRDVGGGGDGAVDGKGRVGAAAERRDGVADDEQDEVPPSPGVEASAGAPQLGQLVDAAAAVEAHVAAALGDERVGAAAAEDGHVGAVLGDEAVVAAAAEERHVADTFRG